MIKIDEIDKLTLLLVEFITKKMYTKSLLNRLRIKTKMTKLQLSCNMRKSNRHLS